MCYTVKNPCLFAFSSGTVRGVFISFIFNFKLGCVGAVKLYKIYVSATTSKALLVQLSFQGFVMTDLVLSLKHQSNGAARGWVDADACHGFTFETVTCNLFYIKINILLSILFEIQRAFWLNTGGRLERARAQMRFPFIFARNFSAPTSRRTVILDSKVFTKSARPVA